MANHPSQANFSSKYTPVFNEFLLKAGVSVLISTYQAGRLILLRPGRVLNTHFVAMSKPMGMAANGARLSVGTGYQIWDYFNMPDVASKVDSATCHDACFIPRRLHITGDIDIHEMAFDSEGELWFLNTRMSCLCTLDHEHSVVPRWRPPFISAYDLSDRCHLNGIAMRDGRPAYVTALGEADTPGGWRETKTSGGILVDIETGRIIRRGLSMPHSPRWYNGKLYVLESGTGKIITVNPEDGKSETVAEVPGFCRGISFVGPYALIGLSRVRETAVFSGLPLTKRFSERFCGIWLVDLRKGNVLGWLQFDAGVHEIFAVEILPWKNPVILDVADPLVRTSYSLPKEALKDLAQQDPDEARINEAIVLRRDGKLRDAAEKLKVLLKMAPHNTRAAYILGDTLAALGNWEEAVDILEKVYRDNPENASACLLLGNCFVELEQYNRALEFYDRALEADRGYAAAHYAKGRLLLRLGRFRQGWKEYQWRRKTAGFQAFNSLNPIWSGEALGRKKLLIHLEQSIQDAIVLARLFSVVSQLCEHLIIASPEPLQVLMEEVPGVSLARLPFNIHDHEFDVYCPLLRLPCLKSIFDPLVPDAGERPPYLKVPSEVAVSPIKGHGELKVGLFWSNESSLFQPFGLEDFIPLTSLEGIDFFGLQSLSNPVHEKMAGECGMEPLDRKMVNLAHMAAFITQLDLVITIDCPVVHLAGGLGIPVWILIKGQSHWCWPVHGSESSWYPTAKIFRLSTSNTTNNVIQQVKVELERLL